MPSSSNNVPVGNPQTGYSINAHDIVQVSLDGLDSLNETDDIKTAISKIKNIKASISGACYRLNVILQQLNARISGSSAAAAATSSTPVGSNIFITFVIPYPSSMATTNPVPILSGTYLPVSARMTCSRESFDSESATPTQLDIQYSSDGVHWYTMLPPSQYIYIVNQFLQGPLFSSFNNVSLTSGMMVRGQMPASSDIGASGVCVVLELEPV